VSESLHYVCPHCHTTNRIASDQLGNQPDCGSCHQPLVTGEPVALDNDSFARHTGRSQLPVVVDFWAPGAAPAA
jgi:thioredoxin 2